VFRSGRDETAAASCGMPTVARLGGGSEASGLQDNARAVPSHGFALVLLVLIAAIVNGAIGFGFSSITVPLALLFLTNRTLVPAIAAIEILLNAYVLYVNRSALPRVRRRMLPLAIGLLPGIGAGTLILARAETAWLKLVTLCVLLPVILLQAAGYRREVRAERVLALPFGFGVGVLYALTTISGPPLALALCNQGLSKQDFRAALGFLRLLESLFATMAYASAGLVLPETATLVLCMVPSVAVGVPLGASIARHVDGETFRRLCIAFDAWIVEVAIAIALRQQGLTNVGNAVLVVVTIVDLCLVHRYVSTRIAPAANAARV
jgi:uncharacterized membrane protein YfcA